MRTWRPWSRRSDAHEFFARRLRLELADYGALPRRAAERVLHTVAGAADAARDLVRRSLLPGAMKESYDELLAERAATLTRPTRDELHDRDALR